MSNNETITMTLTSEQFYFLWDMLEEVQTAAGQAELYNDVIAKFFEAEEEATT